MKKIHYYLFSLILTVGLVLSLPHGVRAQDISGEYAVTVKGTNYFLDITPAQQAISDTTTMKITQVNEKITVEFQTFASAMAGTVLKGKIGNNLMCAVWWNEGSPYENTTIWGTVKGDTITGKLLYPRVAYRDEGAPGTPRLVPGWVEVDFVAKKIKKPDLGMYGFLKIGKYKKEVKWNDTIILTPADATLISAGKPAFEIYYAYREYNGLKVLGPFKNKIFFNDNLVSQQTNLSCNAMAINNIHTQAYLGPQDGKLEIRIDADNEVSEAREDNNFNFCVNIKFQGF